MTCIYSTLIFSICISRTSSNSSNSLNKAPEFAGNEKENFTPTRSSYPVKYFWENQNARSLEENADDKYDFLKNYSVKFQGCHSFLTLDGERRDRRRRLDLRKGQKPQGRRLDQNENEEEEDEKNNVEGKGGFVTVQRLVRFRLCPTDECSDGNRAGCRNAYGDYVVDMATFLSSYVTSREKNRITLCENASYRCGCNDDGGGNDDENNNNNKYYKCQKNCYEKAGLDWCSTWLEEERYEEKYGEDKNKFSLEDFSGECEEWEDGREDENNRRLDNNNNKRYFIGPYCASGGDAIRIGLFKDEFCTVFADSEYGAATYRSVMNNNGNNNKNNNNELPYGSESLVDFTCESCLETRRYEEENNDGEEEDELGEGYAETYTRSAKCENYSNNKKSKSGASGGSECDYYQGIQILERRLSGQVKSRGSWLVSLYIVLMMGILFLTASYAYFLKDRLNKLKHGVSLLESEGSSGDGEEGVW